MSKKKIVQIIAIAFLIVGVVLLVPNTAWNNVTSVYGFISVVMGTIGSLISIFIPSSYTMKFENADWTTLGSSLFEIKIPARKHGMGKTPALTLYFLNNNAYSVAYCSPQIDNKGNITVTVMTQHREGKFVIS